MHGIDNLDGMEIGHGIEIEHGMEILDGWKLDMVWKCPDGMEICNLCHKNTMSIPRMQTHCI